MQKVIFVALLGVALAAGGALLSRPGAPEPGAIGQGHSGEVFAKNSTAVSVPTGAGNEVPLPRSDHDLVDPSLPSPLFVQYAPFHGILDYVNEPQFNPTKMILSAELTQAWATILTERNRELALLQSAFRARVEEWGVILINNGTFIDPMIAGQLPLESNSFRVGTITAGETRIVTVRPGDNVALDIAAEELNSFVRETELLVRQAFK